MRAFYLGAILSIILLANFGIVRADIIDEAANVLKACDPKVNEASNAVNEANSFINEINSKEAEITSLVDNWANMSYKERDKVVVKFVTIYCGGPEKVERDPANCQLPEHITKAKELTDKMKKYRDIVTDCIAKEDAMIRRLKDEIKMLEDMYNKKQCDNYVAYNMKRYDTTKSVAEKAYTPEKYEWTEVKRPYMTDIELATFIDMARSYGHNSEYYGKYTANGKLRKLHKKNWIWQYNWHTFKEYKGLKGELAFRLAKNTLWRANRLENLRGKVVMSAKDYFPWIMVPKQQHIDWTGNYSQAYWYSVRKGETLKKIAGYDFMYGNPNAWRVIWRNMVNEPYGHDYTYLAKIDPIKPGVKKDYVIVAPDAGIKFNRIRQNWVADDDNREIPGTFKHSTHK